MTDHEQDIQELPPALPKGENVIMSHAMFVYLASNSTMVPGVDMDGMNTNLPREGLVKSLAASFAESVDDTSTLCVLAAASPDHGTPQTFLDATLRAITATRSDNPHLDSQTTKAFQQMSSDIKALGKKTSQPTWDESFQAAMWKSDIKPPADFHDKRPAFITLQGQHRLAVFLLALGPRLGLEQERAGRLKTVEPFEGEGAQAQMKALAEGLASTKSRLRVLVHGHISHETAFEIGHSTHKHEAATDAHKHEAAAKRPQLLDIEAFFTPLIRQMQSPAEPICARRAAEFFGYGWEDYFLDSDSGGEKSAARKGIQAKAMDRKAFEAKKEFIEASQTKLMESVLERLTLIGGESKRNRSPIYAVYAMALHPSSAFVAGITEHLQRARNGEIIDHASTSLLDLEVIGSMLRLSAHSQRKNGVWTSLNEHGIKHAARKPMEEFGRVEIFEQLVASLALRVHVDNLWESSVLKKDAPGVFDHGVEVPLSKGKGKPKSTGGGRSNDAKSGLSGAKSEMKCDPDVFAFFEYLLEAFTEDDARFFSANDNKRLDDVVLMAEKWIPVLILFAGKGFDRKHITRKVFQKGLGRIEQRFPALKNRSSVVNGADSKTGAPRPPFVSTSGTVVPISKQVLQEYVLDSDVKGHHGRVMYLCFAVLVVDRALSQGHEEGLDVPQRFKDLWKAMPSSTKPLKDLFLSSAECLTAIDSKGEEEAFFDASRLRFFYLQKEAEAESGVGEDGKEHGLPGTQLPSESRRVVATCERGKFHLSLTTSVLKDLGLVTDDGTLTNKSVEVTLTVEGEDFLEEESIMADPEDNEDTGEPRHDGQPTKRSRSSAESSENDQQSRRCDHQGCTTSASFGPVGSKKAQFCSQHAVDGTVKLVGKNSTARVGLGKKRSRATSSNDLVDPSSSNTAGSSKRARRLHGLPPPLVSVPVKVEPATAS